MTLAALRRSLQLALPELKLEALDALLCQATGWRRVELYAHPERQPDPAARQELTQMQGQLQDGTPLELVLGKCLFDGLPLRLRPGVLIPRVETETLVELAADLLPTGGKVADLGTGSGAIALALKARRPDAQVVGVDIDPVALELATQNGRDLDLEVRWLASNWCASLADERFDMLLTNPPYVESNYDGLAELLRHEPASALVAGPNGLEAIERIVGEAAESGCLSRDGNTGWLLCEHGAGRGSEVRQIMTKQGFLRLPITSGSGRIGALYRRATAVMNEAELLRYSRQISLPQVDIVGQQKLLDSKVLILGAGGLGQPAALYLAGAGIGEIRIADADVSDLSNLHRQIALDTSNLGQAKAVQTAERARQLNPDARIEAIEAHLDEDAIAEQLAQVDLALDASDRFDSRFALARAAAHCGKPVISAAVIRAEGQISLFANDGTGPCYGCLYSPDSADDELDQSCVYNGVLGPMAGMMGCLQALETIKYLTGQGENLSGRLLLVDGWNSRFRQLELKRDPACPICSRADR